MKKIYIEPDIELVNITLISDVLIASKEDFIPEEGTEEGGGGFDNVGDW